MPNYKFKVGKAPLDDIGCGRVRIHYTKRGGHRRFTVFRIASGKTSFLASVLGHDDAEDLILLEIDRRMDLGVEVGKEINLTLTKVGFVGRVCWYLSVPDPTVHVPAWLAFWSIIMGAAGLVLSFLSLVC